jgi:hypothetical protein
MDLDAEFVVAFEAGTAVVSPKLRSLRIRVFASVLPTSTALSAVVTRFPVGGVMLWFA